MKNPAKQLNDALMAGHADTKAAFPDADQVTVNASVFNGRVSTHVSALYGNAWISSIGTDTATVEDAIAALKAKTADTVALRAEAAALIARANKLEGRA
jgi:hypothetical protein